MSNERTPLGVLEGGYSSYDARAVVNNAAQKKKPLRRQVAIAAALMVAALGLVAVVSVAAKARAQRWFDPSLRPKQ